MPPLPADFIHARSCKPFCEKYLTLLAADYMLHMPDKKILEEKLREPTMFVEGTEELSAYRE